MDMKKYIAGIATGVILSCSVALAVNYTATENTFPIQLNGENVNVEGYNIDGSTYFKLRDIADTVGGFNVDFNNNTIQLSKDGYVYETKPSTNDFVLDDNAKSFLAEQGYVIPYFTQNDLKSEDFVKSFIFYYYTEGYGADMSTQYKNGYFEWFENSVRDTYKLLFGADMPEYHPTDNGSVLYENGNYKISVSNRGDGRYEFISAENVGDGMDVVFKNTDSTGTDFGNVTFRLVPTDNANGYIITQKTN